MWSSVLKAKQMLENLSISECLSGAFFFFPLSSPSTSFLIFFLSLAISLLPWTCPSLLGGGIMWSSGELNTEAEAAAAWWIIDGNLGVTHLGLLTSLLLHLAARLTRQNGGSERARERERQREREREREEEEESIVLSEDAACFWLQWIMDEKTTMLKSVLELNSSYKRRRTDSSLRQHKQSKRWVKHTVEGRRWINLDYNGLHDWVSVRNISSALIQSVNRVISQSPQSLTRLFK